MDVSQYLEIFIDETEEHLQTLSDCIMELEKEPENMDTINEIFRAAHSLKGMAGTMGFKRMQRLTHDMENVFQEVRSDKVKVNSNMIDLLFKCLDAIESYLNNVKASSDEGTEDNELIIKELNDFIAGEENAEKKAEEIYLTILCRKENNRIQITQTDTLSNSGSVLTLSLLRQSEYEKLTGTNPALQDGEIFAWISDSTQKSDSITVNDSVFSVKKWMDSSPLTCGRDLIYDNAVFVVTDSDFELFDEMRSEMYKDVSSAPAGQDLTVHLGLNITGSDEEKIAFGTPVLEVIRGLKENGQLSDNSWITSGIRAQEYSSYYADNASLLFIGIFLGSLFLLGTAMIIYYKQISEGYEDQKRFEIMQKVGLTHREVKSSIRRQILMVFFLPLLMAMLHISIAFPLIRRMLLLFGMTNTKLFVGCTAGTVLIFGLVYGLIYLMTAKSYYHIVERK